MSDYSSISDEVLNQLIEELTGDDTEGFILTGSHARYDATVFSDVDFTHFVKELPTKESERYTLRFVDGHLVSISITTVQKKREEMNKPQTAIWAVPGFRQARVLVDRSGKITDLKQSALDFDWAPLQDAANEYASYQLMGYAEEAHKILGGLVRENESTVIYGSLGMVLGASDMIAVQRGILIETENKLYQQLYENVGLDSSWTKYHRLALGLERYVEDIPIYIQRGTAALQLYLETTNLLKPVLKPNHIEVVDSANGIIENSGYL
ncbi:MAG: hypothetical protein ACFFCP_19425 [Promethearchaeota archaeon]